MCCKVAGHSVAIFYLLGKTQSKCLLRVFFAQRAAASACDDSKAVGCLSGPPWVEDEATVKLVPLDLVGMPCGLHPKRRYRHQQFASARKDGHYPPSRADKRDMPERAVRHAGLLERRGYMTLARHSNLPGEQCSPLRAPANCRHFANHLYLRAHDCRAMRRDVTGRAVRHA